ncbi:MAG TPA: GreA/GreB family elongation factor [Archangium sp.]
MSKAFTKEDSGSEEVVLPPRPRSTSGEKRYITPEGYRALQEELASLTALAPREQARRVHQLTAILEEVKVVAPEPPDEEHVYFGAWVTLEDEEGAETTYRLVGADEADVRAGRLSVESPLARALLGRALGESVQVERPRGAVEYTVVRVTYRAPSA